MIFEKKSSILQVELFVFLEKIVSPVFVFLIFSIISLPSLILEQGMIILFWSIFNVINNS